MRREELYLDDILEACADIGEFLTGVDRVRFLADKLVRSAVLQKLIVIGEAASRLPTEFKDRHPDIEWAGIAGLRHRLVHTYFRVDWPIVWVAATDEVPALRERIAEIIRDEREP
jgi:uncharacterized protein with HEPN domain